MGGRRDTKKIGSTQLVQPAGFMVTKAWTPLDHRASRDQVEVFLFPEFDKKWGSIPFYSEFARILFLSYVLYLPIFFPSRCIHILV